MSDWSSDVCSSDLSAVIGRDGNAHGGPFGYGNRNGGSLEEHADKRHTRSAIGDAISTLGVEQPAADHAAARRSSRSQISTSADTRRSEEHTSELQSLMRISYAVFCLKKKTNKNREKQ